MAAQQENKYLLNQALCEALQTRGQEKQAADLVEDWTRTKVRETGFARQILTFGPLAREKLVRRLDTDKPYYIVDKEVDSPAAVTVPYNTVPAGVYIRGSRYPVAFARVQTPMFMKDVDELLTYHIDMRQVLSDNSVKDMLTEEDGQFLAGADALLIGPNTPLPYSGVAQWVTIAGGITRGNLQNGHSTMAKTPSHLEPAIVLTNNVTIRSILKFGRDEFGGDKSQDLLIDGWTMETFMKAKWIISIKRELIPDDTMYYFCEERYLGRAYELEGPTMFIERKGPFIQFYSYEHIGASFGHTGGVCRVDYE